MVRGARVAIERRMFLKQGALAFLSLGLPPGFLARTLFAESAAARRGRTLICIFQRGAVDGLAMIPPFGESAYYGARGTIAIPQPGAVGGAIDLDGFFGLHPALEPLAPLYRSRELAIVHACGSPHPTRSHFEAQDYMETAAPGDRDVRDGWLNRALAATPCDCGRTLADGPAHAADHAAGQAALAESSPLRGIAVGGDLPLALRGATPTLAIPDLERFGIGTRRRGADPGAESALAELYRGEEGLIAGAADESFEAVDRLRRADPLRYEPAAGVKYPAGPFGRSLRQIAQLVKADVGLEVAFADVGGWDTHQAQGGSGGQLAIRLAQLGQGIRALHDDLGDRMEDVVILTMSEFGRTVAENGTGGTDHGHGTCMLALGGPVDGGRVLGSWPGLDPDALHERRDLAVTTDFRDVFAEIVVRHLKAERPALVFPGHPIEPARFPALLA
ncbi:MAG TPA: DUF1501 domain-containing protein [Gemmatimonadota bacterium]|nr:DUF1501 domain-containing protein [Gemmatimonadota bacterium]